MTNYELIKITGGADLITSTIINALVRLVDTTLELGRTLGTSIRRYTDGNLC